MDGADTGEIVPMPDEDYVSAMVDWIAEAARQRGLPLLRQHADKRDPRSGERAPRVGKRPPWSDKRALRAGKRALHTKLALAVGPVIAQAASEYKCALWLRECFRAPARLRPDHSGQGSDDLRTAIAVQIARSLPAYPDGRLAQDAEADPSWPAEQLADAAMRAVHRVTMDSVVSYLQARGFVALTFGYYKIQYKALRLNGDRQPDGPRLIPFLKGLRELSVNLSAVVRHLPTVIGISIWQALTQTVLEALRTAPAMLAVIIFLFLTGDAWQIFGSEAVWRVISLLVLLLLVSLIFFFAGSAPRDDGLIREILPLRHDVQELAQNTPAVFWARAGIEPDCVGLGRGQALNAKGIYIALMIGNFLAVGFLTAITLMGFGLLAFDGSIQAHLMGTMHTNVLWTPTIAGHQLVFTSQLMMVSLMLAGIAVLSFAVSLQVKDNRTAFCGANITDLQSCISAYYYYRAVAEHL
jgi:hypothetical protein